MLEKQIEERVCEYARSRNILVYKFTSPSRAAVPDRLFILPDGRIWFCEFKRGGQKSTPQQMREHVRLRSYNVQVFVVDNVKDGRDMVDLMIDMTLKC